MKKVVKKKLPEGWRWAKLGGKEGIAKIVSGSTPSTDVPEYWDGDIPWVTPSDIGNLKSIYIENTERKITKAGLESCSTTLLPTGTVLLTSRAPVGNIAIATKPMCTNQGFKSFIPKEGISSLYLYFAIKNIIPAIIKKSHGNTFVEITKEFINEFEIPLPPTIQEQNAIANKFEHKINEAELIKGATSREHEAISAMQGALLRGVFPYREGDKLPRGWTWESLKKLSRNIQYGFSQSSTKNPVGPRLLRITDIQDGEVSWDTVPYCECTEKEREQYLLEDGDIVFTRTGATTGKSFLVKKPENAVFASYLIRVQSNKAMILPEFLDLYFQSSSYWKAINKGARGGTLAGFNATMLSKLMIPYPTDTDEQKTIIKAVRLKQSSINTLTKASAAELDAAEALSGAILREKFSFDTAGVKG